jgi:hypothetical protein
MRRAFLIAIGLLILSAGCKSLATDVLVVSTLHGDGTITGDLTGSLTGNGVLTLHAPALAFPQIVAAWTGCSAGTPLLAYDGTCAAGGSPAAGSNGQVQFNNSNVLGASAGFSWDNTNKFLTLTGPSGAVITSAPGDIGVTLIGGSALTGLTGASTSVGAGGGTSGAGGTATLTAGNAAVSGKGGDVTIASGNGVGTNQQGGTINISAGNDTGSAVNSTISLSTQGVIRQFVAHDGGITIGSPSGGSQGAGSINAAGLYINGVAAGTGSGSVTSVGLIVPSWLTVTGSPVTTSGNIQISAAGSQVANRVLATPDGTTGALSLRALVGADIPAINMGTSGNGGVTGSLIAASGGTGRNTLTAHALLIGNATSAVSFVGPLAADTVLLGQGASADPAGATLSNCNGGTNALQYSTSTHTFGCQSIGGGGATFQQVFKTGNTSRATASPTVDPDLQFASVPAGNHTIQCSIIWTNPLSTINIRYGIATSGTTTFANFSGVNVTTGGGGGFGLVSFPVGADPGAFSNGTATIQTANTIANINIFGSFITTTSGTVSFGWGQLTSDAGNATTVKAGSYCQIS